MDPIHLLDCIPSKPFTPSVMTSVDPLWRVLLILGRVSNLPTVWSNCLAGWFISGGGDVLELPRLLTGASCLYVAGMFLNDAFDAEFDGRFCPTRPIPSGALPARWVWILGFALLLAGMGCFIGQGSTTVSLAWTLAACILWYNWVHKKSILSPFIMAACRSLLFLTAASTASGGIDGRALWLSVALGSYIVGLSYVAKTEHQPGVFRYWPFPFLLAPVLFGFLLNDGDRFMPMIVIVSMLLLWTASSLQHLFDQTNPNPGKCVSGLLAGIVWVDLLAIGGDSFQLNVALPMLFLLARTFQRHIPAT